MNKDLIIKKYGLNDSQANIVINRSRELIVPAGAGSGKTKTLVTKVVELIKQGIPLENFLVLTFTNKAAAEMKARIKTMLKDLGLNHLVNKIDSANISTFDSFAYNFVKQNANLIGLSSDIELLDDAVLRSIKESIVYDIVYKIMNDVNSPYYELLANYTRKTAEEIFVSDFISLYESLIKTKKIKYYTVHELIDFKLLFKDFNLREEIIKINSDYLLDNEERVLNYENYINHLINDGPNNFVKIKNNFKQVSDHDKKSISKLFESIDTLQNGGVTKATVNNYYNTLIKHVEKLLELLIKFDELLYEFKQTSNKFEHRDNAEFLNLILINNPLILERLKNKTKYVFVDEYQDTSLIQTTFLNLIIKENPTIKVLYVGDIKQSIYKFRDAKPETFLEKLKSVDNIPLNINYRSSKPIIDFVNNIFTNILTSPKKHDIIYKNEHEMLSGSTSFNNDPHASVYLLEANSLEGKRNIRDEAFIVGNKILELKEKGIASKFSDFAILTRNKTGFNVISDVFKYLNIPIQVQKDFNLQNTYYLKLISNILTLSLNLEKLDYDKFKFDYFSLLRSELINRSDFDLYNLFTNEEFNEFNKDNEIYKKLLIINSAIKTKSNNQIIKTVVEQFEIYKQMLIAPKSFEKELQINYLLSIAKPLNDIGVYGLSFVNYIKDLAYSSDAINQKILLDEDENSVVLTNIHQSKGLEYKILFLIDLDKPIKSRTNEHFAYEKEAKFISQIKVNNEFELLSKQLKNDALRLENKEALKEELRLLYTAITRAKRMLFIVGIPKDGYSNLNSYNDYLYHFGMKSFIDKNNIISINDKLGDKDYFIKLKDNNSYYPDEVNFLKEHKLNFNKVLKEEFKSSIKINTLIDDKTKESLLKGTINHEKMEYGDLFNKLINKNFTKEKIELATIYKELPFYLEDEESIKEGIIDLVLEFNNEVYIIDYKTYDIDANIYDLQLKSYEKYLKEVYPNKIIYIYLYSIIKDELLLVR